MQYFVITPLTFKSHAMMMKNDLELIVDEPIAGHFYWTILWRGQPGELPRVVDYARGPLPTNSTATRIGAAALRLQQTIDAGSGRERAKSPSAMRLEWAVETMPASLV